MPKKSIIAVLCAVACLVIVSVSLVLTSELWTNADSGEAVLIPTEYLNVYGKTLFGFTTDGENYVKNLSSYKVIVPDGVTCIGVEAFNGCTGLTSIEIPNSVTDIYYRAFNNCTNLTSIEIPSSVATIDIQVFRLCSGLTSVTFAENSRLTSISDAAFCYCGRLTSIEIPAGVTSIFSSAFSGCSGLTSITVDPANTTYTSRDDSGNECNCIIRKSDNVLRCGCQNTRIPDGVTSIGNSAFSGCSRLTNIEIPASVTSIGDSAFSKCSGLTAVTFVENSQLISIGNTTFLDCYKLTSIEIPAGVTSIGSSVFARCGVTEIIVRHPDLINNSNLTTNNNATVYYGADQNTVSFVTNCDTSVDSRTIDYGDTTTEPALEKAGYTFAGWYRDSVFTKPFTFDKPIKYNLTLYAKWEIKKYAVTFDSQEGSFVTSLTDIEHGTLITEPTAPTREGYIFKGWYVGEEKYDFTEPVTDNVTLTAKWEALPAEVEDSNNVNIGLIAAVAGSAVVLVIGIVVAVVVIKRRHKL